MPEFRPVPAEDVEAFHALVSYAFRPEEGPFEESDLDEIPEGAKVGDRYGLYAGDDLLTACKHINFRTHVRGDVHDLHGLSAVASPPDRRRQGLVRELLRESLVQSRRDGVYLSALWPFKRSFYAQYGWATGTRAVSHELDPEVLSFAPDHDHGEFVSLDADDWERTAAVHDAHGKRYDLTMNRTEEWWRTRVFAGWQDDPYVYGWERDGNLVAYAAYSFDSDEDGKTLQVRDWAFVDHEARLALLRFFADHDSQVDEISFWTHPSEDVLDLLPNTDEVEVELHLCPMVRLVDVREALQALSFPDGVDADLVLDVTDPLVDWNDDTFRLTVEDGEATVERVASVDDVDADVDADSSADSDADADAELGVGALSQLAVGYRSADDLATVGKIDADTGAVTSLADVFPENPTFLREGF